MHPGRRALSLVVLLAGACSSSHGLREVDAATASLDSAVDARWVDPPMDARISEAGPMDGASDDAARDSGRSDAGSRDSGANDAAASDAAGSDDASADATSECRVGAGGYPTIQAAIDDPACTTVIVGAGTHHEDLVVSRSVALVGGAADATIAGVGAAAVAITGVGTAVIIDGLAVSNASDRCLLVSDAELALTNATIGPCTLMTSVASSGAGLSASRSRIQISHTTFHDDSITYDGTFDATVAGAAIGAFESEVIVEDCSFLSMSLTADLPPDRATSASGAVVTAAGGSLSMGQATIRDVRIDVTGFEASVWGGVISVRAPTTIRDMTVDDVHVRARGARSFVMPVLAASADDVRLEGATITNVDVLVENTEITRYFGTVYVWDRADLVLDRVAVVAVSVAVQAPTVLMQGLGAGVYGVSSEMTDCAFDALSVSITGVGVTPEIFVHGAAIYGGDANLSLRRTTISRVSATYVGPADTHRVFWLGGGLAFMNGGNPPLALDLENVTIADIDFAVPGSEGGAIYHRAAGGVVRAMHLTIDSVSAATGAAFSIPLGTATIRSSLVSRTAGDAPCVAGELGSVAAVTLESVLSDVVLDCVDPPVIATGDLGLGTLGHHGGTTETIDLLPGSRALDALPAAECVGLDSLPLTEDQRGQPRPWGAGCDVGAFEAGG